MIWFTKKKDEEKAPETVVEKPSGESWLTRLIKGLSRSSSQLKESISALFTKKKLDQKTLDELEEMLIAADLGVSTSSRLIRELSAERFDKEVTEEEVRETFAASLEKILEPVAKPLALNPDKKPFVVLVAGVNGAGKTTTIGKLAHYYRSQKKKVMLAAGDTFRAAAVEQLKVWGERTGCEVIAKETGADAAALAYEAYDHAKTTGVDMLFIDTAGRLQNKANLMAELEKVVRVIKKHDLDAPHACLLVLDATTGQNAHSQVELFSKVAPVSGLVITKLDGTAKGGVVISLAERFGLPIHAIGIGEGKDDLQPFEARDFARSLMGF